MIGQPCSQDVPMPVVTLNRITLVVGVAAGLALGSPLLTTAIFLIVLAATAFGRRASLIYLVGSRLFRVRCEQAMAAGRWEDRRMMRFNNGIAAALLGGAQAAFLVDQPVVGWGLALMVALAATIALAGFCLGCFLYTQLRMNSLARARS